MLVTIYGGRILELHVLVGVYMKMEDGAQAGAGLRMKVFLKDILYVESLKDYVMVHTINEDLIVHHNLQSFTELLPASSFTRIHRSYTVSLEKIKAIDGNQVEIGGKYLPIGRNYQSEVKSKILNS